MTFLDNFKEWFEIMSKYIYGYFAATLIVIGLFLLFNVLWDRNFIHNFSLVKMVKFLKKAPRENGEFDLSSMVIPKKYAKDWDNYKNSINRYPSEFFKLEYSKSRFTFVGFSSFMLLIDAAFISANIIKFGWSPKLIYIMFSLAAVFVVAVGFVFWSDSLKKTITKKYYNGFCSYLDFFFGTNFFIKNAKVFEDYCSNKDVDTAIEKIENLKAMGIGDETAKEVASILSQDTLNKPRTVAQQQKINIALNGLLQVLYKKSELKKTTDTPLMS